MRKAISYNKIKPLICRMTVIMVVFCYLIPLPAQAQLSADPPKASFESHGSLWDPGHEPRPCGKIPNAAPLSGSFAEEPCNLTRDNRSLEYTSTFGGQKFAVYLEAWWNQEMLPSLKKMAAQLQASRIDQTRQIAGMIDGQLLAAIATGEQAQKLESLIEEKPHELSCVAGTHTTALAQTSHMTDALTGGFVHDLNERANNKKGNGPVADQKARWEEYCEQFQDPTSNNGVSVCPQPGTPGKTVNGDINIEGFLLKDTINLSNANEYKAASALLRNIVEPNIVDKIPDDTLDTVTGRERILLLQHLQSIRNIAASVVSSMIARRANSAPDLPSAPLLKSMRLKAGISEARTSLQPSYNETMLTLTKERFYDPEYFIRMHDDIAAVRQEQASIQAYITMQYADIHKLQEQINALLAARAALKLNSDEKPSHAEMNPLHNNP